MGKAKDLTRKQFDRLTVKSFIGSIRGLRRWLCLCKCGKYISVVARDLISGHTTSCGCFGREQRLKGITTHGLTLRGELPSTYKTWQHIKDRCFNPKNKAYKNYGGRGISVCDRWLKFENFLEDMGDRPSPKLTLDRRDNDGNYCKENCRWVTRKIQNNNKRVSVQSKWFIAKNTIIGVEHRHYSMKLFAEEQGLNRASISHCCTDRQSTHKGWIFKWLKGE